MGVFFFVLVILTTLEIILFAVNPLILLLNDLAVFLNLFPHLSSLNMFIFVVTYPTVSFSLGIRNDLLRVLIESSVNPDPFNPPLPESFRAIELLIYCNSAVFTNSFTRSNKLLTVRGTTGVVHAAINSLFNSPLVLGANFTNYYPLALAPHLRVPWP